MWSVGSLAELERYYDAVPRSAARVEEIGPFTLFVGTGAWPYYARPRLDAFTVADIEACSGDVSADSSDQAVDAALAGDGVLADRRLQKALEAGVNPQTILLALQRQMQTLETLRRAVDHAGASAAAAVASSRPPVFFSRKRLMEEVVASWSGDAVRRVLERLQSSILESRRHAELAQALTRQSLLTVAAESARGRRHRLLLISDS